MKTQVEVEMEVEQSADDLEEGEDGFLPQEPIITIEEEEEVVLFWESGQKSKGLYPVKLWLQLADNRLHTENCHRS